MTDLLPIRIHNENGLLAVRDGLVFVLFIRKAHEEFCESAAVLYDTFTNLVGADTLQWVHDRGEFFRPFNARARARVRQLLTPEVAAKRPDELFTVKGGGRESEAGDFLFRYQGRDMKGRLANVNASFVEMWFPTEFPAKSGMKSFVDALLKMADAVPFSSGYCSIGFNRPDWARAGSSAFVRGKAARYPGMDIHNTMSTAIRIADEVRGAYWMTFVGQNSLERLHMHEKEIRQALGSDISVYSLSSGVAIQAGAEPMTGDVNRGDNLPLIRKVAALIEPVRHTQTVGIFDFDDVDGFVKWQRRHLL